MYMTMVQEGRQAHPFCRKDWAKEDRGARETGRNEQVPRRSETILNTGADILVVLQWSRDSQPDMLIKMDGS